jgi:hypothetical protein
MAIACGRLSLPITGEIAPKKVQTSASENWGNWGTSDPKVQTSKAALGIGGLKPIPRGGKSRQKSRLSDDGEGRNRTGDTTIFSRVLYQLSYLAREARGCGRAWEG